MGSGAAGAGERVGVHTPQKLEDALLSSGESLWRQWHKQDGPRTLSVMAGAWALGCTGEGGARVELGRPDLPRQRSACLSPPLRRNL